MIMSSAERGSNIPLERALAGIRDVADTIWGRLAQLRKEGGPARVMFVGDEPGAGTTVLAAATALGIARNLRSEVTLVEASFQRPALARYLGLPTDALGVSDVLYGRANLRQALQEVAGCPGLLAVTGGTARAPIAGEFAAEPAEAMFTELEKRGDYVFLDAPPIIDHPETRVMLRHVDGLVLILRARSSRRDTAARALEIAEEAGVPVLGSVLNRWKSELPLSLDRFFRRR
jgi:Mrp family chromosome partitioning ATPase